MQKTRAFHRAKRTKYKGWKKIYTTDRGNRQSQSQFLGFPLKKVAPRQKHCNTNVNKINKTKARHDWKQGWGIKYTHDQNKNTKWNT